MPQLQLHHFTLNLCSNPPSMIEWLEPEKYCQACHILFENGQWNHIAGNMLRHARGDDDSSLERWLMAGNPCYACFAVEAYQGCQQPVWHSTVQDEAVLGWHGRKCWPFLLYLQMVKVIGVDVNREYQCIPVCSRPDDHLFR